MPFNRPNLPLAETLVQEFERAIQGLVTRFRLHPYCFYTESDMHCYLYSRLYQGGRINGLYRTAEGYDTILLHKEYPTVARYLREEGRLTACENGRRRGAFDITIWDPATIRELEHRKQRVLCAAELALDECGTRNLHTINDAIKLSCSINAVKHPYLLFFVRTIKDFNRNQERIIADLNSAAENGICVIFAMADQETTCRAQYVGPWKNNHATKRMQDIHMRRRSKKLFDD